MDPGSLRTLLFVTSVGSLFSMFVSASWSVWQIISCLAPFKKKWFLLRAHVSALSSSSKIEYFFWAGQMTVEP